MIFDKSEDPNWPTAPLARELVQAGIPVAVDARVAIAHNKVMVIDAARVLTGSYNWMVAAEYKNAENLVVLDSPEIARRYRENWARRYAVSKPVRQ